MVDVANDGIIWTFRQTDGKLPRKTLTLSGWNAPFGRPRKDPVIKETIKSRIQTTRYPGSNAQTRHAFGTNYESTELKGRWMTKAQPDGKNANEIADEWIKFVQDERTCSINWGFLVQYTGYISEIEISRESPSEIAWRMKIEIDQRDNDAIRTGGATNKPISDDLADIKAFQAGSKKLFDSTAPDMSPDLFDFLNNLAGLANFPSSVLNKLASRFDEIEKASFATIQHFRGAVTGLKSAYLTNLETVDNVSIDSAILIRSAESDLAWLQYQLDLDLETLFMVDMLNKIDRKAELAQKPEADKFVIAVDGDSWESLATRVFGGPTRAGELRALNGAKYGAKPESGVRYLVP